MSLRRPIVLRIHTTHGIAAEPNRWKCCVWNSRDHVTTLPIAFYRRGNFCGSVFRCVLWLNDAYATAKVSEEVNRKCPAIGTRRYKFQPLRPTLSATVHSVTDRQTDRQKDWLTDDSIMPRTNHTECMHAAVRSTKNWKINETWVRPEARTRGPPGRNTYM